jgi:hypothetical protein
MSNFVYSKAGASWLGGVGKAVAGIGKRVPGASAMSKLNAKARQVFINGTSGPSATPAQHAAGAARYTDLRNKYVGGAALAGTAGLGTVGAGAYWLGARHGSNGLSQAYDNFHKADLGTKFTTIYQGMLGLDPRVISANLAAATKTASEGKVAFSLIGNGIKGLLKKTKIGDSASKSLRLANVAKGSLAHIKSLPAITAPTDAVLQEALQAGVEFAERRAARSSRLIGAGVLSAPVVGDLAIRGKDSYPAKAFGWAKDKVTGQSGDSDLTKQLKNFAGVTVPAFLSKNKDHLALGALGGAGVLGASYLASSTMPLSTRLALAGIGGAGAGLGHAYWPELTKAISDATSKKPDTMLRSILPK